jgi:anti-anti-sigma regulatory factor
LDTANSTGLKWLENLLADLQASGNQMVLSGVGSSMMEYLKNTGFDKKIGEDNIFPAQKGLTASTIAALKAAEAKISKKDE